MWPSFRLIFAAAVFVAVSFFVVAFTSSYAFGRARVEHVNADLASAIRADYSADPRGARLAPLDEEIVDVARQDVSSLQETVSGVEIVAVYHQPASAAPNPQLFATPSASGGQAPPSKPTEGKPTPSPTPGVTPGWPTPGPWSTPEPATPPPAGPSATPKPTPTPAPTSPSTPGPSPITTLTPTLTPSPTQTRTPTPGPSPSPTGSPTRTPTATPAPTAAPTASPTRSPTPSPSPSPTPSPTPTPTPMPWDGTLYLHNNPTPPVGDTSSQSVLPMDSVLPTASVLYNYDVDRNASPGLTIAKGGSGPHESDPTKYQAWVTAPLPAATVVDGTVMAHLWTATANFDVALGGAISAYLLDCNGLGCVELGGGTLSDALWQHGQQTWVLKTVSFPVGTHTVAPGNTLELVVVVEPSSSGDMWFAYDANDLKSRVAVPATPVSAVGSEAGLSAVVARWLAQPWARLLFA